MRDIIAAVFDAGQHICISVPSHMKITQAKGRLVVEGKIPDTGTYKVDHHVRIEFLPADGIDSLRTTCRKNERYTFGPDSSQPGRKVSHGGWCKTDWVLRWLADGMI